MRPVENHKREHVFERNMREMTCVHSHTAAFVTTHAHAPEAARKAMCIAAGNIARKLYQMHGCRGTPPSIRLADHTHPDEQRPVQSDVCSNKGCTSDAPTSARFVVHTRVVYPRAARAGTALLPALMHTRCMILQVHTCSHSSPRAISPAAQTRGMYRASRITVLGRQERDVARAHEASVSEARTRAHFASK